MGGAGIHRGLEREREGGVAWGREGICPGPTVSLCQLQREALGQSRQLLLPLLYEVVKVALATQKGRFGADEAAVALELRFGEVAGQDGVDHTLPPVQVLLQLPSIIGLTEEQGALVEEGVLKRRRQQNIDRGILFITNI